MSSSIPSDSNTPGPVDASMYDAADGLDLRILREWLVGHRPRSTGPWTMADISDVITALQAVGDATLVKNSTYRAMRKDGAAIERLNAWMQNHGMAEAVVQRDGNAVEAAIDALQHFREMEAVDRG